MSLARIASRIRKYLENLEIIDCHEHLPPESVRLSKKVDVFTLFSHYTQGDLARAGMPQEQIKNLTNPEIPLDRRWRIFAPYWEKIRWTCYSRAALLAAKKFYQADDIHGNNYQQITQRMQTMNKPGIYDLVLRKTCHIRAVLTQCGSTETESPLLKPVMPMSYPLETAESLLHPPFAPEEKIKTLDDYLKACYEYVFRVKKQGAVGLKLICQPFGHPDRRQAITFFRKIISVKGSPLPRRKTWPTYPLSHVLRDYVTEEMIRFATEKNLVVAVHTGYWGDFRSLDPLHLIPLLQRNPGTCFDIYHCGYPWVRETLMLGKGFSNVWLNFCWTHIISQKFAREALEEALDLLPTNKILAFGGDYRDPVEKVYGHLVMARENISAVLARRVYSGRMKEKDALKIARKWFLENPSSLYRLNLQH